jgi:hypothetical protein
VNEHITPELVMMVVVIAMVLTMMLLLCTPAVGQFSQQDRM